MLIFISVILGLCFGSFVNALVWRIYQQQLPKKKRAASDKELYITTGRSMCTHCKHTLAWYDLLPVLSWLSVGGKCRYCKKPIGWQYPVVELVTAVLFAWSTSTLYGTGSAEAVVVLVVWLVSLVMLVALAVYDIRWMLLPNRVVFPLTAVAALGVLLQVFVFEGGFEYLLSAILALLVAGGIFYALFQLSGGQWIGGGDVKLGFALGLLLGSPVLAFMMLFVASLLGLIVAVPGLLSRKTGMSNKIPFGPYLIAATILVMLHGETVWSWYQTAVLTL